MYNSIDQARSHRSVTSIRSAYSRGNSRLSKQSASRKDVVNLTLENDRLKQKMQSIKEGNSELHNEISRLRARLEGADLVHKKY